MAYKIVKNATAWWPIVWNGVAEDSSIVENEIELRFERMGVAEFNTMFAEGNTSSNEQVWDRVVRDWRGVEDANGNPLDMKPAAIADLFDTANFGSAVGLAYVKFFYAIAETRLGNSSASLAGGPVAADLTAAPGNTPTA